MHWMRHNNFCLRFSGLSTDKIWNANKVINYLPNKYMEVQLKGQLLMLMQEQENKYSNLGVP